MALTRLGPTFIKIGQILSVREDVIGPVWATELAKLQDGIAPVSGTVAIEAIGRSLGNLGEYSIDPEPAAAASIAQVHRAVYRGQDVAIKVLRPGVVEHVAIDLCVLLRASELMATWVPRVLPNSRIDWRALLLALSTALWEETNLDGEAERQRRFALNMESVPRVTVPAVITSTREVMVTEWCDGTPLRKVTSQPVLRASQRLMRDAYCQAMFLDSFFHADCHGGNLLYIGDADAPDEASAGEGQLCILDCGLMVEIEPEASEGLLRLSLHLAARDWPQVVDDARLRTLLETAQQGTAASARDAERATRLAESLAPRLGREEEFVLARLPSALADESRAEGESQGAAPGGLPSLPLPSAFDDLMAVRIAGKPEES